MQVAFPGVFTCPAACQLTTYKQAYCWLRGRTTTFPSFCLSNFYQTQWGVMNAQYGWYFSDHFYFLALKIFIVFYCWKLKIIKKFRLNILQFYLATYVKNCFPQKMGSCSNSWLFAFISDESWDTESTEQAGLATNTTCELFVSHHIMSWSIYRIRNWNW